MLNLLARLAANRNFLLLAAVVLGISLPSVAKYLKDATLPVIMVIMTVSAVRIPSDSFISLRKLVGPMLLGVGLNYILLSIVMLGLARLLVPQQEMWAGFVLVAVAPPGFAIVPFTFILGGDVALSTLASVGGYLATLILAPAMAVLLIGGAALDPLRILIVATELIVLPMVVSRLLIVTGIGRRMDRWIGTIINWGFFIVLLTVVGLNRAVLIDQPRVFWALAAVGLTSIFGVGSLIMFASRRFVPERAKRISLTLLGSMKNSGWASVTALALIGEEASAPGAVCSVANVLYLLWLGWLEGRGAKARHRKAEPD